MSEQGARPSLAGIRARVEAATEGPWTHYYPDQCCRGRCVVAAGGFGFHNGDPGVAPAADAEFIAHARTDVPALVAAVKAVLTLPPDPGPPQFEGGNFVGFTSPDRHRTVGQRAWSDSGEWCYQSDPCPICSEPVTGAQIRAIIAEHLDLEDQ